MMGVVEDIIDDGVKVFGSGGRLHRDAKASAAPASPEKPAKVKAADSAPAPKGKRSWNWRGIGSTVLELVGISGVSFGAFQIYPPAGWITAGVALTVLGIATGVER